MRPGSFRRALILAGIEEIRSDNDQILKVLTEYLPDHFTTIMDVVGTSIINVSGKTVKQPVKHILRVPDRQQKNENSGGSFIGKFVRLPNGMIIEMD